MSEIRAVPIAGLEHIYQIDEHGNVFSLRGKKSYNAAEGKMLRQSTSSRSGAKLVALRMPDNSYKQWHVHTLVALAFVGKPGSDQYKWRVKHKDNDQANTHYSNLYWVRLANLEQEHDEIFRLHSEEGMSAMHIALLYDADHTGISRILKSGRKT